MECMLKIVSSISLQGSSLFDDLDDEGDGEQNENKSSNQTSSIEVVPCSSKREVEKENDAEQPKKKIKLTTLDPVRHAEGSRASTLKHTNKVEDEKKSVLQESLCKTKEMFDKLLQVCQDQESSEDMQKVVSKLNSGYKKADTKFLGSEQFQNMLESETEKISKSEEKPWTSLYLLLKEIKHNRKTLLSKVKSGASEGDQGAQGSENEQNILECQKKRKELKMLEKTLMRLNKKILKLEEKEVDMDDNDSTYIQLDRYRERFTKVYSKVCKMRGKMDDAERLYLRKVSFAGSDCATPPHIIRCIEKYYNKYRQFPDFFDVKDLIIKANNQENIQMLPGKIHSIAQTCFKEFGEMLKRLRQHDDYLIASSYLPDQSDPARDDPELQEKLHKNFLERKNVQDVIDHFARCQDGLADDDVIHEEKKKKRNKLSSNELLEEKRENLSDHDSSDTSYNSADEKQRLLRQKKRLRSSSSEEESTSEEGKRAIDKGKTLIGKTKLIKGSTLKSPKKRVLPTVSLSSDESGETTDPKDSLTNYLGLQVAPTTDEKKTDVESIQGEKSPSRVNNKEVNINQNQNTKLSPLERLIKNTDSDSDKDVSKQVNCDSGNSDSTVKVQDRKSSVKAENIKSCKTHNVRKKRKIDVKSSLYSSSENSDDSGDDDSEKVVKSGEISDISLSDDSDEKVNAEKKSEINEIDEDEPVVIISEETPVPKQLSVEKISSARRKRSEGSSESDDIIILSQDSDKSNKGPVIRKLPPTSRPKQKLYSLANPAIKRCIPTFGQTNKPQAKKIGPLQSSSGIFMKQKRIDGVGNSRNSSLANNQLPPRMNGTARKTFRNPPQPVPKVVEIPVIQLD